MSRSATVVDFAANAFNAAEQRRTRKRITAAQLAQLEELYYRSSHPTRDQRDALAKRIQMETKSVTIWFQNKRQTDRKVALHNATNSRNAAAPRGPAGHPNITLTTPTSPACPSAPSVPQEGAPRPASERPTRRPSVTRSNALKRVPSNASSHASSGASTSSTSIAMPSLDRVASRSQIRFTDRAPPPSRSTSTSGTDGGGGGAHSLVSGVLSHTPSLSSLPSTLACSDSSAGSVPPVSPLSCTDPPLWSNMLSSPITPSSPPSADVVAYTRARKTRTLDWACAAARLARGMSLALPEDAPMDATATTPSSPLSALAPAAAVCIPGKHSAALVAAAAAACAREYEEAMAMTEDEAELVTPHGSQDASMPWAGDRGDAKSVTSTCPAEAMRAMGLMQETHGTEVMVVDKRGWEEDEVHAALALCGLRG